MRFIRVVVLLFLAFALTGCAGLVEAIKKTNRVREAPVVLAAVVLSRGKSTVS